MPELPEVETIVRALDPGLRGKQVESLELLHPRVAQDSDSERLRETVRGAVIESVERRGKYILIHWRDERPVLAIHLRMTGRLLLSPHPLAGPHLRACFHLTDGSVLNFEDIRTFGSFFLLEGKVPAGYRNLGVEPLSSKFTMRLLGEILRGRKTAVKTLLMRQDLIAGVGNIYASEACFRAGVDPAKRGADLGTDEISKLHRALRSVLREAVRELGTTFSDFRRPDGKTGNFANKLRVYGRAGKPCLKCGQMIERKVINGRSAFFCPRCQHAESSG